MDRYGLLLGILLVGAGALGAVLWQVHESKSGTRTGAVASSGTPPNEGAEVKPSTSTGPPPSLANRSTAEAAFFNEAYRLPPVRGLEFQQVFDFVRLSPDELAGQWRKQMDVYYPADTLERMGVSYQLAGLLDVDVDLSDTVPGIFALAETCVYDPPTGKLFYTDACDPKDPEARRELLVQLMLLLSDQNLDWYQNQKLPEAHADRALAERSFFLADAVLHAGKVLDYEDLKAPDTALPQFVRDWKHFHEEEGVAFCQALIDEGISLDSVYQRPPSTVSHLLHPERFLQTPRYRAREIAWPQIRFQDTEPAWDNVVGELHLRSLFREVLPENEADEIAAGWDGDRLALFLLDGQYPHLAWKLVWRDEAAASQAYEAFQRHAVKVFGVAEANRKTRDDGAAVEFSAQLSLLLERQGDALNVVRYTNPAFSGALQSYVRGATAR